MNQQQFTNKVVWITGASSGIGEALAYQLSKQGAILILSARRKEELERVRSACSGDMIAILPLDLGDEGSVRSAAQHVIDTYPTVDFLFNNGGISQRSEAISTDLEVDRRIFEVNFFGNILLSKMIAQKMVHQGFGHIVVTSSLVGKWGFYLRSAYSASKHALHGYYESMRMEVENHGVSISLVLPGFTQTEISKHALTAEGAAANTSDKNQEKGLSPDYVAQKILEGVGKKKFEISIGKTEALGLVVRRYFPGLFNRLVRKWSAQ